MTTLTIILLIVVAIRRTRLSFLVGFATVGADLASGPLSLATDQLDQWFIVTGFAVLLVVVSLVHWRKEDKEVSKYITWFAFAVLAISFINLTVFGFVSDHIWHDRIQEVLDSCVDWIAMASIACLLFLPDRPESLHELVRSLYARFVRMGNGGNLPSNRESKR